MNERQTGAPAPGMNLRDILYVIFRRKWLIAIVSAVGLIAALGVPLIIKPTYQSEAKLYVRYVLETGSPSQEGPNGSDSRIRLPQTQGDTIMNTEVEILNNLGLAQQVASAVGPEKILGGDGSGGTGGDPTNNAAVEILKSLAVEVPKNTSVLHLTFKHGNPEIVTSVLQQLIDSYFKKHTEIHVIGAMDEALVKEIDERRSRLEKTKEELRQAK
jgi:uncharacterized protein involved in exopolysaccharide biosynthesis